MRLWVFLLMACAGMAQSVFDVASVKQGGPIAPNGMLDIDLGSAQHGVVTLTNATLSECIRYAYGLTNEEQISGPAWIRDRAYRFTIIAKAQPETPRDQLHLMLQNLLKERFQIEMRHERRNIRHYELIVARGGPRLVESKPDTPTRSVFYGRGRLAYNHEDIGRYVVLLSRLIKEPIFDHTGLTGFYDIDLRWTPDDVPPPPDAAPLPDLFAAIQRQLGLKLEPSKEPLDVLVVDRAEKVPVAN